MGDSMQQEIWRPALGFDGVYEVSDQGRVRSVDRVTVFSGRWGTVRRKQRGTILKPLNHPGGYKRVCFWLDGTYRSAFIHTLVLEAFVGPRPTGMEAAHNDGSKDNNVLSNLRWATPSENQADRERHGTGRVGKGSYIRKRVSCDLVLHLRKEFAAGSLSVGELARAFGIPRTTVADIVNGRTRKNVA